MSLTDLSDPRAVRKAMAEFDRIGREAFLEKYGIGEARSWRLMGERSRIDYADYDAEAIVGVAYGHQYPCQGPVLITSYQEGLVAVRLLKKKLGFTICEPIQDPDPLWTHDELILALDIYMRRRLQIRDYRPGNPGSKNRDVVGLADLLCRRAVLDRRAGAGSRFRNPSQVAKRIAIFAHLDRTGERWADLSQDGSAEDEVWQDFADDPVALRATADAIRAAPSTGEVLPAADEDGDDGLAEAAEWRKLMRLHQVHERSRTIVRTRKEQAFKRHGRLACEACGFDFGDRYGERGRGFIECHHTRPVHTLREGEKTRLVDLALLCANCHRMVHARRTWLNLDQLRALLAST